MSNEASAQIFLQRSQMIAEIRNFLHDRGYLEVETPMLQSVAGGAAARPFETLPQRARYGSNAPYRPRALPQAPPRRWLYQNLRTESELPQ